MERQGDGLRESSDESFWSQEHAGPTSKGPVTQVINPVSKRSKFNRSSHHRIQRFNLRYVLRNALLGQFLVTQNHKKSKRTKHQQSKSKVQAKHNQSTSKAQKKHKQRTIKAQAMLSQSTSKANKAQIKLRQGVVTRHNYTQCQDTKNQIAKCRFLTT